MKQLIIRLKKNNVKKFDISGLMNNSNLDKKKIAALVTKQKKKQSKKYSKTSSVWFKLFSW